MTEYERIREKIAKELCAIDGWNWEQLEEKHIRMGQDKTHSDYYRWASQILSLDGIEIKSDDQSLPENFWTSKQIEDPVTEYDTIKGAGFDAATRNMLKEGFVKVIPKPNNERRE